MIVWILLFWALDNNINLHCNMLCEIIMRSLFSFCSGACGSCSHVSEGHQHY